MNAHQLIEAAVAGSIGVLFAVAAVRALRSGWTRRRNNKRKAKP